MRFVLLALAAVSLLLIATGFASRSHWLVPHGKITCQGKSVDGAKLYRSHRGDVFAFQRDGREGTAGVLLSEHLLMRCNTPAFTHVFGLVFSREAEPSSQCGDMWKGGTPDEVPYHVVTDTFAEFPWDTCEKLRLEY